MKIVLLSQYYPPETGAPQGRLGNLTRRLSHRGHDITVVTAMPNYPTGQISPAWRRRLIASETSPDDVKILRSWLYTSPVRSLSRQMSTYLSFAGTAAANAVVHIRRADIVLWESPPLFLAPTAALIAKRVGARLVMNVSDLWPESAIELGMVRSPRLEKLLYSFARWTYRRADLILGQTEGILSGIRDLNPNATLALFPNGVDLDLLHREPTSRPATLRGFGIPEDAFVVGYVGNFGRGQALQQILDAADLTTDPSVWFLLVGDGPMRPAIAARAAACINPRVVLADAVPHHEAVAIVSSIDLAVVPLADVSLLDGARPSKMFELMALQTPFVYCGRGEGAAIASRSGAATIVNPMDPVELSLAVTAWRATEISERESAGARGLAFVRAHFDRDIIADSVEAELHSLMLGTNKTPQS